MQQSDSFFPSWSYNKSYNIYFFKKLKKKKNTTYNSTIFSIELIDWIIFHPRLDVEELFLRILIDDDSEVLF